VVTRVKKVGTAQDKLELMQALSDSHLKLGSAQLAMDVVADMQEHFEDINDNEGNAAALMSMCTLTMKEERYDEALKSATKAQVIFHTEEDLKGEADALRQLCEIHGRKEEHKAAVRAAESARAHFRELHDRPGETMVLYLLAQNAVLLAIREGARVKESAHASRTCREALGKASKSVTTAVKQAREIEGAEQLLACCLCTLSQVEMLSARPSEALVAADEGIVLFREAGDYVSEASALLLSADALRQTKQYKDSQEAALEALRLFKDGNDSLGVERAEELLGFLKPLLRPDPVAAPAPQLAIAGATPMQMHSVNYADQEAAPDQAVSAVVRADRKKGDALDMSIALNEDAVKKKVLEIALAVTGADDGEIEEDTPLMEAGLTSNSAILMRDELSQELPGISLPVTLVFDYPSIAAMSELILESTAKALK